MSNPHPDFEKTILLMQEQIGILQREFGHIVTKKHLISDQVNYPGHSDETVTVRKGIHSMIEGSLLIYLFAMWDEHTPEGLERWFKEEELEELRAFTHVRDSIAHRYNGKRAKIPQRRRDSFEKKYPFSGIVWNSEDDTIDISNSSVALDCFRMMEELTKTLVVRLHENKQP